MAEAICIQLKQSCSTSSASQSAPTTRVSITQLLDILDRFKKVAAEGVDMARKLSVAIMRIESDARGARDRAEMDAHEADVKGADKNAKEAAQCVTRAAPHVKDLKNIFAEIERMLSSLNQQIDMLEAHRQSASGKDKAGLTGVLKRAAELQEYLNERVEEISNYVQKSDLVERYAEEAKQHAQSARYGMPDRNAEEAPKDLTPSEIKEFQKWADKGLDAFERIRKRASSTRAATEELFAELGEAVASKDSVDTAQWLAERISMCLDDLQGESQTLRTKEQEAQERADVLEENLNPTGKHTPADDALSDTQNLAELSGQLAEKIENYLKTRKLKLAKLVKQIQKPSVKTAKRA